jgi:aspartyl-tRNA(Asn)/glutamyl-tRNA(Gln) amidotransferase subunit B
MTHSLWEPVIGLEIHAQLNTKTKLFSPAPNNYGDEPNCNISFADTGQPGSLPVLNKEAVKKAVQLGLAIHAEVARFSKFDRKSYFYPDSPRNYQITQFDQPIILGGSIEAEVNGEVKSFQVDRAHLEDDAGMLKHFEGFATIDYNRAGVPLIEIVSKPCLHSAEDAVAYAKAIKSILEYLDASTCNMDEGALRFDANISVRKKGEKTLRNKIEIKNMNSFYNLSLAIASEISRQIALYENPGDKTADELIPSATYRFDPETRTPILMRRKENAEDYRYFPEPDLTPIILSEKYIEDIRLHLPELPLERKQRYMEEYKLAHDIAYLLTNEKALADYFEITLKIAPHPRTLANWLLVEFAGRLKSQGLTITTSKIAPEHMGELVAYISNGTITGPIAKEMADIMTAHPQKSPKEILQENPQFKPMNNLDELTKIVKEVLDDNQQSIFDLRQGNERAFGYLVGQVMKKTQGKASPIEVNRLIKENLK